MTNLISERRRHIRVAVNLSGRYMLSDRSEHPCRVVDLSTHGLRMTTAIVPRIGERVVAYLEELGRIEGLTKRTTRHGFAMTIEATPRKRQHYEALMTLLATQATSDPEQRSQPRLIPFQKTCMISFDGETQGAWVTEFTSERAFLRCAVTPPLGAVIWIGRHALTVTRLISAGFVADFTTPLDPAEATETFAF